MTNEEKAIKLLEQLPDDMDYPTDSEFRSALNNWYDSEVVPFLEKVRKEKRNGSKG